MILIAGFAVSAIGTLYCIEKIRTLALGIPILFLLIMIYHPSKIYEMGREPVLGGDLPSWFAALFISVYVFIVGLLFLLIKKIVRKIRKN